MNGMVGTYVLMGGSTIAKNRRWVLLRLARARIRPPDDVLWDIVVGERTVARCGRFFVLSCLEQYPVVESEGSKSGKLYVHMCVLSFSLEALSNQ